MDLLTMATNGLLFGFGAWASFLILGGIAVLVFILGNAVFNFVERQK